MTNRQGFWGMILLLLSVSGLSLFGHRNREDKVVREQLGEGQRLARAICLKAAEQGFFPPDGASLEEALGEEYPSAQSWFWMNNSRYQKCLFFSSEKGSDLFLFIKDQGHGNYAVYTLVHDKMRPHTDGNCSIDKRRRSKCIKRLAPILFRIGKTLRYPTDIESRRTGE